MNEHFIKEIEIKNYKCFIDFKAQGFARVNLIGGKNNVGKTAFMEACYIVSNAKNSLIKVKLPTITDVLNQLETNINSNKENVENSQSVYFNIIESLIVIELFRKKDLFYLEWMREEFDFQNIQPFNINLVTFNLYFKANNLQYRHDESKELSHYSILDFNKSSLYRKIYKKNHLPLVSNNAFIHFCNNLNATMIDELKLNGQYSYINKILKEIFNLDMIDNIKNQIMVQENGKYLSISEFGDGLKNFIHIIIVLLSHKMRVVFIDEIENGIHYTKLDDMWRVILKLSQENSVQIFATTHSKECIESYARVAKELEEEDIAFVSLYKEKDTQIKSLVFDYDAIQTRLELDLDNR
jgi:AAA15 family ATPase/GTPase